MVKIKNRFEILDWGLVVKKSKTGLGLFATKEIPEGMCLIEYFGRVISEVEKYTCRSKYLFEISSKITIDGSDRKNIARYINHSCKSNAEAEIKKGKIYIFSKRKIKAGEELSYDYGEEYFDEHIKKRGCGCNGCAEKSK
ncbi:MAG: SET domain-containing protein [bacterium]